MSGSTIPVAGGGAGSFEQWWAQHASFSYFVKNAHSLYLETLGELGLVGFGILALFVLTSVVLGARALRQRSTDSRVTASALFAVFVAYLASRRDRLGLGTDSRYGAQYLRARSPACVVAAAEEAAAGSKRAVRRGTSSAHHGGSRGHRRGGDPDARAAADRQ